MQRFGYKRAVSIDDAVALLNEPGFRSAPIAGGTDLLLQIREKPSLCDRLVDVSRIAEMQQIEKDGDWIVIGAAVCFRAVVESSIVNETGGVLVQACKQIGAEQIRNMGTLGGNVANAAACADSLPALVCLDAIAEVVSPGSREEWPVSDLVLGPNKTRIPQGGLLVSIKYRIPHEENRHVFLKLGRRNAMAISRLTVAAMGRLDSDGRIAETRFVPGATTPRVSRFRTVEDHLFGQMPNSDVYQAAGMLAVEEMIGQAGRRWSSEFKEKALTAMSSKAFGMVFGQTGSGC